jgi:hypothetical protein
VAAAARGGSRRDEAVAAASATPGVGLDPDGHGAAFGYDASTADLLVLAGSGATGIGAVPGVPPAVAPVPGARGAAAPKRK